MRASLAAVLVLTAGCRAEPEPAVSEVPPGPPVADSIEAPPPVALAVEGEGLRIVDGTTGSTTPLPFGTPAEAVHTALARIIGRAPDEEGPGIECGPATYSTWENGISVWMNDRGFAGWSIFDADSPLTTMAGIGIGSTLAEIEQVMVVDVMETTIGTEFAAGGLAGLLNGTGPEASVTHLWAGETCIAR